MTIKLQFKNIKTVKKKKLPTLIKKRGFYKKKKQNDTV